MWAKMGKKSWLWTVISLVLEGVNENRDFSSLSLAKWTWMVFPPSPPRKIWSPSSPSSITSDSSSICTRVREIETELDLHRAGLMGTELDCGNALVTRARKGCRTRNRNIELASGRSSSKKASCSKDPNRARLPRNKNWSIATGFLSSSVCHRVRFSPSSVC